MAAPGESSLSKNIILKDAKGEVLHQETQLLMDSGFEGYQKPLILCSMEPNNPIISANRAFTELTGYEPKDIIGKSPMNFLQSHAKGQKGGLDASIKEKTSQIQKALQSSLGIMVQIPAYKKNGEKFINKLKLRSITQKDENGKERVVGYLGVMEDYSMQYWLKNLLFGLLTAMLVLYASSVVYQYYHKPVTKTETFWNHLRDYFPQLPYFSTVKKEADVHTLWSHLTSYLPSFSTVKNQLPDVAKKHM